jgi:ubiquinone/menaquinone biosynthesis C-methylase UbiE
VDIERHIRENPTVDARVVFDGRHLPFRDQTFSACTMQWVVEHLLEPRATFREIARVMRTGGRLVILTSNLWFYGYLLSRLIPNRAHPWIVRHFAGRAEREAFPTFYRANTRRSLRTALVRAGFRERALVGFQHGAGYLEFSVATLLLGAAYDWLVNVSPALAGLRQGLVADFERS